MVDKVLKSASMTKELQEKYYTFIYDIINLCSYSFDLVFVHYIQILLFTGSLNSEHLTNSLQWLMKSIW